MSAPYGCCAKPEKNGAFSISVLLPYFAISIFSLLSILRDPAFVYVQALIYIVIAVFGNRRWAVVGLIAVVYGSYSAPMDNELRFSGEYPSIHTMKILGPLKGIDVILAVLAIINLKRFHYLIRKINAKNALIFISALLIGLFGTAVYQLSQQNSFDVQYALFITRGIFFFLIATAALSRLSRNDLSDVINYAIFTCLILMFLSHLFPPHNILSRELFGINLNVVFAGDEYNSMGLLIAALLILNPKNQFKKAYVICFLALTLALFAGRKAALLYFSIIVIMIFSESIKKNSNIKWFFQLEFLAPIILLVVIANSNLDILKLAFIESLAILEPTIDSIVGILNDSNLNGIIGIGPFSKYPLIGIDPLFDHPFSFGEQAGELYKIKLWFFPYERAFLNFGIAFGVLYLGFLISQRKSRPAHFYITGWLLYFFALNPVSNLGILSLALGYSALQQMNKSRSVFASGKPVNAKPLLN